jgi:hypothetical protein
LFSQNNVGLFRGAKGLSPNRDSIRWSKKLQPLSRARCSELAMWDLIASGVAFEHPVIE